MRQAIAGYSRDEAGDWVAHLTCGHRQHVRHDPPFAQRQWVLSAAGRGGMLGTALDCPPCERGEPPAGLVLARTSAEWDAESMPPGLRGEHRLAAATWGRLVVRDGSLRLVFATREAVVEDGAPAWIPPDTPHGVQLSGPVRFAVEFHRAPPPPADDDEQGGEAACYAHLLCEECGVVLVPGVAHRPGCSQAS